MSTDNTTAPTPHNAADVHTSGATEMSPALVRETVGGEPYEYFPLGQHVVSAPSVCRGRPTFKYTRIEVSGVLDWLGAGNSLEELVRRYEGKVPREAIQEAATLAAKALVRESAGATGSR